MILLRRVTEYDNKTCPECKVQFKENDFVVDDNETGLYHEACMKKMLDRYFNKLNGVL